MPPLDKHLQMLPDLQLDLNGDTSRIRMSIWRKISETDLLAVKTDKGLD